MKKTNRKLDAMQSYSLLIAICSGIYFVDNFHVFVYNSKHYYIAKGIVAAVCAVLLYFIFMKILKVIFKTIYIKDDWKNFWIMFIINMICYIVAGIIAVCIHLPYILLYTLYILFIILAIQIHNTIAKNSELENNNL